MADWDSKRPTGAPPVLLSKPAVLRGDTLRVVGPVAFTGFQRAGCAWSAPEAEQGVKRALGTCPRWGMVRAGTTDLRVKPAGGAS